jgi:DNA ligase 1
MRQFAATCEAIAATTRKSEKIRVVADYFHSRGVEECAASAVFLSGRPFPAYDETKLQVGGALLARVIVEVSESDESALMRAYRNRGDLGAAAYDLVSERNTAGGVGAADLSVLDVMAMFRKIAATRGPAAKAELLRDLLAHTTPVEVKYIVKIITGELRIGLKESLVEESIAAGYECAIADVQRANMLLGDIGQCLRLAAEHRLGEARMRLFHPLGFMLASAAESAGEAHSYFQHALVENKYDGIRAQAHVSSDRVRIFSRTLDDITGWFPELVPPLAGFREDAILDGEILAWDFGQRRALPFHRLQQRLGRKRPTAAQMREVPVAYVLFDLLYAGSELVIDRPLRERVAVLDRLFGGRVEAVIAPDFPVEEQQVLPFNEHEKTHPSQNRARMGHPLEVGLNAQMRHLVDRRIEPPGEMPALRRVLRAPGQRADSAEHLARIFEAALKGGDEGLMIKDVESPYTPGRRGRSWLKLKRELATLDVVVTSVEWGHGRRIKVLSDYTFAVRNANDELLNVGKAYSGLTDREIAELTDYFLEHTTADHGFWREVEPRLVIEVAFNGVMRSDRHNSGYALRFPRILRLRPDKTPEEIDTIERVREIYESQKVQRSA